MKAKKYLVFIDVFIFIIGFFIKIPLLDITIIIIKMTLIELYLMIFIVTTSKIKMVYGFQKIIFFLKPFQINVVKLSIWIMNIVTFIPNILEEKNRVLASIHSKEQNCLKSKDKLAQLKLLGIIILNSVQKKYSNFYFAYTYYEHPYQMKWNGFDSYMLMMHVLILFVVLKRGL